MSQTIDVTGLSPEAVRMVEQLVASLREQPAQGTSPSSTSKTDATVDPWEAAAEAVQGLSDYDFDAWADQRAFDERHGKDHLK